MRFSYVLLKNDCLTMSATVFGTGNLELIQKHNFRSLRAQIVYTHYRKNPPPKFDLTPKSWTIYFKPRIEFCIAQGSVLLV